MPDLTPAERLQPSLLDRLTDEHPDRQQESRDQRVLSLRKLRAAVVRDLRWLLNASGLSATEDLDAYPLVADSVLNYGCPEMAGVAASSIDMSRMQQAIREAIVRFEPRLLPASVRVTVVPTDGVMNHRALTLEIEGQLWAQPLPEHLFLRTELDLETGDVRIEERGGG